MASYSSGNVSAKKICSTCQYWNGERSVSLNKLQIQYLTNEKYKCSSFIASKKEMTKGNDGCYKWSKWIMI